MNWINIQIKNIRSAEIVGSSPAEVGTWLLALAFCCEQENNGRIKSSKSWKTRQMQRAVGITHKEILNADKLMFWDGDDLVVKFYPIEKQEEVKAKRYAGNVTAGKRWKKQVNSSANSSVHTEVEVELELEKELKNKHIAESSISETATAKSVKKKEKDDKVEYAEFVHMTPAEYQKLLDEYGEDRTKRMIAVLDNAKGSKGYKYKSDYRAILTWVRDKVIAEMGKYDPEHEIYAVDEYTGDKYTKKQYDALVAQLKAEAEERKANAAKVNK